MGWGKEWVQPTGASVRFLTAGGVLRPLPLLVLESSVDESIRSEGELCCLTRRKGGKLGSSGQGKPDGVNSRIMQWGQATR